MISKDEVKHIANLARIGITKKELDKFSHDLSSILDWIKLLEEVDITDVSPTTRVTGAINVSREDRILDFKEKDAIIKLFPQEKNGYDKVKSVL